MVVLLCISLKVDSDVYTIWMPNNTINSFYYVRIYTYTPVMAHCLLTDHWCCMMLIIIQVCWASESFIQEFSTLMYYISFDIDIIGWYPANICNKIFTYITIFDSTYLYKHIIFQRIATKHIHFSVYTIILFTTAPHCTK